MRCHARHALPSHTTDAHQQGIASRLSDDASRSRQMFLSILEEHQVHLARVHAVVLLQSFLKHELRLSRVRGSHVRLLVAVEEVAVHQVRETLHGPRDLQVFLQVFGQAVVEPGTVLLVDQAISELTTGLVDPEPGETLRVAKLRSDVHHQHALQHLGRISQVEGVVTLHRRGQQIRDGAKEHLNTGRDHLVRPVLQRRFLHPQPAAQNGAEDSMHGVLRQSRHPNHVEVT
mmetsp:Transcript_65607/g.133205  ORF Transcript_65607/g.133205 Transcript_65607/m.133205 type:complete len:231 (+) Transcript_65607:5162-5854(+)